MGFDRDLSDNSYELSVSRVKIVHKKKQNTKLYTLYMLTEVAEGSTI